MRDSKKVREREGERVIDINRPFILFLGIRKWALLHIDTLSFSSVKNVRERQREIYFFSVL